MDSEHELNKSFKFEKYHETFCKHIFNFLITEVFVNVTLVCKEEIVKAHQIVLASCSPFFEKILTVQSNPHPTIVFPDIPKNEMVLLLEYMYTGHVNVRKSIAPSLLVTAKKLQLRGFNYDEINNVENNVEENVQSNNFNLDLSPILTKTLNAPIGTEGQNNTITNLDTGRTNGERSVWITKASCSVKQESEITGRSKKVINPFAKKKRNVSDSDSTVYDDDPSTPGPSKKKKGSSAAINHDSDVEFIDNDPSVVVIMDSQISKSPEVYNIAQKYHKGTVRTNPHKQLDYTSDESDLVMPSPKKTKKNVISDHSEGDSDTTPNVSVNPAALKKRCNHLNHGESPVLCSSQGRNAGESSLGVNRSNEPVQGSSKTDSASVPSKKTREPPEGYVRMSYKNLRSFCVICYKKKKDMRKHFQGHKNLSNRGKRVTCKTCHRKFVFEKVLAMHMCEQQKNVVDKLLSQ